MVHALDTAKHRWAGLSSRESSVDIDSRIENTADEDDRLASPNLLHLGSRSLKAAETPPQDDNLLLLLTVAAEQRPFFVIGHMANSVDEVDSFVEKGSNAVETDVRFTANGTVTRVHHGFPCDCLRNCSHEAKFKGKLLFLFLDLKTSDIDEAYKYQAGVDLSTKLTEHLWRNGFEFGDFKSPSENEEAFAELGIDGHRWQGDGVTNCLVDFLGDFKLPEIVACRDGQSTDCDYVDKAYAWTVDTPRTIETMIK
ncbi:hypothetical protein HPB48_016704 [Haemaphysalis longicornis]|uniref:Uncharacterized protein n=1 Tax=Haemaphysalis longicornis TaxID=44386 RepID=A0A9J6GRH7_HAELO|nr:hypothetical protein HPB48_016704 [Haemaphysalis longicornis]